MQPFSMIDLAGREEGRLARGVGKVARVAEPIGGGAMAHGGPDSWLDHAVGLGLHGPVAPQEIDRLIAFYRERGARPRIEVASCADESLLAALAARGFVLRSFLHVLARTLDADESFEERLPFGWPRGVELVRVDPRDDALVKIFASACTIGFRPAHEPIAPAIVAFVRALVASDTVECFLALIDGEPAGGGCLEIDGDHAGLITTSVDPRFRGRGIQQALIAHRLERARARGAVTAAIASAPGSTTERNARRFGFHLAYAKALLELPDPIA